MFCCKTVKNNVICKLHFFFLTLILISSDCTFLLIPIFFLLLGLLVKWPPLGHVEESHSTQLEKRPYIVIQDLELTRLRHRVRSSVYIITLLALFSLENQSIRKRNFKDKLTVKYLGSAYFFVMM